ncbi:LysR family transcriptional regulator [Ramlibacter rhizophilus]|uniref:LysR family transcriptional regulator n=1 Tax=Ramlibacter rhizophilus TaxID=1781167 RepID=A0A4Z0C0M7_9BURK|nr:LysR family transcriptional regulator [Ramlibacter rhizophilus]TFZ05083.1 LysR family transcriptional regulator [Ramlibacter rhizophilus]
MNVSSRQLLAFLEICRLQSFARAAETIPLSPSGVSMLVKELEEQVGARLFERTTRSVTLTEAGRRLQPVAERIVGELRSLEAVIGGAQEAVRSRLDVAATPMVAATLLPAVVRRFAETHRNVRVRLADVDVNMVRRRVLEEEADIGLGFFIKPAAGLVREPVCRFRLMRISPPGTQPPGLGPSRPWSSLKGLPLVSLPTDNPIQALIEKHLGRLGSQPQDRPRMNLISTLIGMVQAGHGHAIVPSFVLDECVRHGLSVAMLVEPAVHLDLFLVSRRGAAGKPAAADFAQALKAAAARLAG